MHTIKNKNILSVPGAGCGGGFLADFWITNFGAGLESATKLIKNY